MFTAIPTTSEFTTLFIVRGSLSLIKGGGGYRCVILYALEIIIEDNYSILYSHILQNKGNFGK